MSKIFKIIGYSWIYLNIGIFFYSIANIWIHSGFAKVQYILSPFNISNYVVTIVVFSPGFLFLWLSEKTK